jgi:beta-galactosidase
MGGEIASLGERIDATAPVASVAVLYGFDSRWAMQPSGYPPHTHNVHEAVAWHEGLKRRNVTTDVMDPRADLSAYDLVIAPRLWLVDDDTAANLTTYVAGGGVLVLTAGSGVVDAGGKSFEAPRPGPLAQLAGLSVTDLLLPEEPVELASELIPALDGTTGGVVADIVHPDGTEVLATFASGWREGAPALLRHRVKEGTVYYAAAQPDTAAIDALVTWLANETGLTPVVETPDGVTAYERRSEAERIIFLLNYGEQEALVPLVGEWVDLLSGKTVSQVTVGAADLAILSQQVGPGGEGSFG